MILKFSDFVSSTIPPKDYLVIGSMAYGVFLGVITHLNYQLKPMIS